MIPYSLIKQHIFILVVSFPIFGCFPTSTPNLFTASKLFTPYWDVKKCEIRKIFRTQALILNTDPKWDDSMFNTDYSCRLWRTAPTFTTGSSTLAPARTLQRAAESSASSDATFKPPGMDGWQVKAPRVGARDGRDMLGLGASCLELALIPFLGLAVDFSRKSVHTEGFLR